MTKYKVFIVLIIFWLVSIPYVDARTIGRRYSWSPWRSPQRFAVPAKRTVSAPPVAPVVVPVKPAEIDADGNAIRYQHNATALPSIFARVADCESNGNQYDTNGNVVHGRVDWNDIGKYQINQGYWGDEAYRLGHDIYTPSGNAAMALEIYNRRGLEPWSSSQWCWGQYR